MACALAINSSLIDASTNKREGALQLSPWLKKMEPTAAATALSRSGQSAHTMLADLPPNSVHARFKFDWPAICTISFPVRVEPVKPMQSTSMCSASAAPASLP